MNFNNLFSEIERKDPEGYKELENRRDVLKALTRKAGKIAVTSLPFAVASLFRTYL
jgi:hypothetical protein